MNKEKDLPQSRKAAKPQSRKAAEVAKGRKVILKNRIPDLLCVPSRPLRLCGSMNVMLSMENGIRSCRRSPEHLCFSSRVSTLPRGFDSAALRPCGMASHFKHTASAALRALQLKDFLDHDSFLRDSILPAATALKLAWPSGVVGWLVRGGVDPLLIGSVLHRLNALGGVPPSSPSFSGREKCTPAWPERSAGTPPVSLFKGAARPRLVSSTTMASADSCPDRSRQVSRGNSAATLLSPWAGSEPATAAGWAACFPAGETRELAIPSIASRWAATEPEKSMAWTLSLPDSPERGKALDDSVRAWAEVSPENLISWVDQQPQGVAADDLRSLAAESLLENRPESAMDIATKIPDAAVREKLIHKCLKRWMKDTPEAAENWAARHGQNIPENAGK